MRQNNGILIYDFEDCFDLYALRLLIMQTSNESYVSLLVSEGHDNPHTHQSTRSEACGQGVGETPLQRHGKNNVGKTCHHVQK